MTEKELRKLSRLELLEILVEKSREADRLREELERVQAELNSKQILISRAGSIAQASLELNKIFEAAQNAADQYLENIVAHSQNLTPEQIKEFIALHRSNRASMVQNDLSSNPADPLTGMNLSNPNMSTISNTNELASASSRASTDLNPVNSDLSALNGLNTAGNDIAGATSATTFMAATPVPAVNPADSELAGSMDPGMTDLNQAETADLYTTLQDPASAGTDEVNIQTAQADTAEAETAADFSGSANSYPEYSGYPDYPGYLEKPDSYQNYPEFFEGSQSFEDRNGTQLTPDQDQVTYGAGEMPVPPVPSQTFSEESVSPQIFSEQPATAAAYRNSTDPANLNLINSGYSTENMDISSDNDGIFPTVEDDIHGLDQSQPEICSTEQINPIYNDKPIYAPYQQDDQLNPNGMHPGFDQHIMPDQIISAAGGYESVSGYQYGYDPQMQNPDGSGFQENQYPSYPQTRSFESQRNGNQIFANPFPNQQAYDPYSRISQQPGMDPYLEPIYQQHLAGESANYPVTKNDLLEGRRQCLGDSPEAQFPYSQNQNFGQVNLPDLRAHQDLTLDQDPLGYTRSRTSASSYEESHYSSSSTTYPGGRVTWSQSQRQVQYQTSEEATFQPGNYRTNQEFTQMASHTSISFRNSQRSMSLNPAGMNPDPSQSYASPYDQGYAAGRQGYPVYPPYTSGQNPAADNYSDYTGNPSSIVQGNMNSQNSSDWDHPASAASSHSYSETPSGQGSNSIPGQIHQDYPDYEDPRSKYWN